MAEFASPQKTQRALEKLLELQSTDPNGLNGILNKYGNPFVSWPLLKEPTEAFLRFFETVGPGPEGGQTSQRSINPKLQEMIDVFDKEIIDARAGRVKASTAAKQYINALIKKAKEARLPLPETEAPPSREPEGAGVSPERVGSAIGAAILRPGPPEEKEMFFQTLVSLASEQPAKTVEALLPRAEAVAQASWVLTAPEGPFPKKTSFSLLATNGPQRVAAGFFDVMIRDAATKEAIINKVLLSRMDTVVNRPKNLPAAIVQNFVDRWGEGFTNSVWFEKLRADANRMMAEQRGAFKIRSGFINFASDLATTVFRAPPDENFLAYMEAHRFLGAQGVPVGNVFFARNVLLGFGGRMIRTGMKYTPLGLFGGVGRPGATVPGGAGVLFGGVVGGLLRANQRSLSAVLNRGVNSLLGFFRRLKSVQTKINGWLIAGAVVFLFVLFILPIFGQSMIDTSIATGTRESGISNDSPIPPPNFGPVNGSISDCLYSQGTNIEGTATRTLTPDSSERGRLLSISQTYPLLGCYKQVLNCPSTRINITEFAANSGGYGAYAPSGEPGNIIFYPVFFTYNDYYFARTFAHEMMHEVEWLHSNIYDAFMNGTTDGSFAKGYCGPLGTYKAGNENPYETMAEAAGLYMVGNPLLQQKCQPAYNFMRTLFSQCQK